MTRHGVTVVASSRLWAPMLEHFRDGESLTFFNGVAGAVSILPTLTTSVAVVFVSGLAFGAVLLSAVASTTVLVRHNLSQGSWSSAASVFTVVFAFGQIVGPVMMGRIADGPGNLEHGLIVSAIALFIVGAPASRQKALKIKMTSPVAVTQCQRDAEERPSFPGWRKAVDLVNSFAALRRSFRGSPICGPIAVTQYLVAGMDREFDQHSSLGNSQHFAADVDNATPQFEALVERPPSPDLHEHHCDRLEPVRTEVEKIVFAEFGDAHIGAPRLRLHDLRIETAQTRREVPLGLRGVFLRQVQMQVRHALDPLLVLKAAGPAPGATAPSMHPVVM
jgi:hypothetical protein